MSDDDRLAAHALDSLPDAEADALEWELRNDPEARAELDSLRAAAAALGQAVATPPPPGLRAQVLARIADEPQEPAHAEATSIPPVRRRRLAPVVVGLAAAVVVVVAAALVLTQRGGDGPTTEAVLADPAAVTIELHGEAGGSVEVVYSPAEDAVVILGRDLPAVAPGRTYELWRIAGADPEPAALFAPDATGAVEVRVDGLDPRGAVLAVTDEPAEGSDLPTTEPLYVSA